MDWESLISVADAARGLVNPGWRFFDCRYTLGDAGKGRRDYAAGHLPGASFASLDDDMASPHIRGVTGRHPLPSKEAWQATLTRWGIQPDIQIVAYDDGVGQSAAGRFWWMLKWAGFDRVAVMDGGMPAWRAAGLPLSTDIPAGLTPGAYTPVWRDELQITTAELERRLKAGEVVVVDARAAERYRGEVEAVDPVAGHIPGALSAPLTQNIVGGKMADREALAARFSALVSNRPAGEVVMSCGSGVSAAQNALAFAVAGRGLPRLYVGSWSEWITDPRRGVATGS